MAHFFTYLFVSFLAFHYLLIMLSSVRLFVWVFLSGRASPLRHWAYSAYPRCVSQRNILFNQKAFLKCYISRHFTDWIIFPLPFQPLSILQCIFPIDSPFAWFYRFLLSTHYTRYDHHPALFSLNLISLVALALIPKLPQLHRQRLSFGSQPEGFHNGDLSTGANTRESRFSFFFFTFHTSLLLLFCSATL